MLHWQVLNWGGRHVGIGDDNLLPLKADTWHSLPKALKRLVKIAGTQWRKTKIMATVWSKQGKNKHRLIRMRNSGLLGGCLPLGCDGMWANSCPECAGLCYCLRAETGSEDVVHWQRWQCWIALSLAALLSRLKDHLRLGMSSAS